MYTEKNENNLPSTRKDNDKADCKATYDKNLNFKMKE